MFTGIIEEIGSLKARVMSGQGATLTIGAAKVLEDLRLGDSIAIDGACLTVIRFSPSSFDAEASAETLRKTTLGALRMGARLNLERALRLDQRLGGHLVSGHVDGLGIIQKIEREGKSLVFYVNASPDILDYIVQKGSIAIDGISLTINDVDKSGFSVNVIPHTAENTALAEKKTGQAVNLETDMLGKYIEKFMSARFGGGGEKGRSVDLDLLKRSGFLQ
ncbi:MAG: riboflavin synthase [Candidatus Tectomicrobia bacterium]|uniref:Riboflavin synthase n=1 Tax=Tectimicrobiota bacterium TaxID=2528274 RepID=A0A933LRF1_UNCTE|nr:riboflavin synthase [Candidatus Tectomicrobia bacterium]